MDVDEPKKGFLVCNLMSDQAQSAESVNAQQNMQSAADPSTKGLYWIDVATIEAEKPDLALLGLSLASLAKLTYEKDQAAVRSTLENAGLQLVTEFQNPFEKRGTQGFVAETENRLILAFRGTDEPVDWLRNLRLDPTRWWNIYRYRVHKGFAESLSVVWAVAVAKVLKRAKEKPVIILGHSLGGAMAMLAASRFEPSTVRWIHTYGQPLTGTPPFCADFAARFAGKYVRWVNNEDVVARVPPEPIYGHTGILKHFDAAGELLEVEDVKEHERHLWSMTKEELQAFRTKLGQRQEQRGDGQRMNPPPGVADHSMTNGYLPKLRRLAGV